MKKTAITPTRDENYPEWYQQVILAADMAESSPVRGCMVIKPWGYALWENMQKILDAMFKATGHVNAYFPLLIPLNHLEKEAEHVDGFAKECAVVTHHRLQDDGHGKLIPDGKLEEPLVIRPTSETMVGTMYAKWIQSYRDLPILINQWANVMRWEMRTRLFLRTSEFLWQEGHTAHASSNEAVTETLDMLETYANFAENYLAIPVIKGEKTTSERFPGAVNTYCIEAMMQDGKALQAGTSHFLGQTFSKAYNIQFLDKDGQMQHVWTTSWGVSTRLIGGIIMTHGDDDGLRLPPAIAPHQVVILPIFRNDEEREKVLNFCKDIQQQLSAQVAFAEKLRVHIDSRDMRGGEKSWQWVKKGVPIRLEIGPRDIENGAITMYRRDEAPKARQNIDANALTSTVCDTLVAIQQNLFAEAQKRHEDNLVTADSLDEFMSLFDPAHKHAKNHQGFVACLAADSGKVENIIKPLKVTARCIPMQQDRAPGACIFTGEENSKMIVFAKAY